MGGVVRLAGEQEATGLLELGVGQGPVEADDDAVGILGARVDPPAANAATSAGVPTTNAERCDVCFWRKATVASPEVRIWSRVAGIPSAASRSR